MKYGSLLTGVGGFDLGFNELGWEGSWMSEIDKYAKGVLGYQFPEVPLYGDIFEIDGSEIEPVDVICGGFPCQSFSVAGKKTGDGLIVFREFVRVVNEMREATNGEYPRAVVWENVPGLVSKTKDWISDIYTTWAEIGAVVQEHRVIDAKYFGVPQRRRRIIGVVIFDTGADCGSEILFDSESSEGDTGKSGEAGEQLISGLGESLADSGNLPTVINSWYKGPGNTQVDTGCIIPFDTTQVTSPQNGSNPQPGDECHPISASAKAPAIAFHLKQDPINGTDSPALGTTSAGMGVYESLQARRLTPRECERLMGWPDDWTAYQDNGNRTSDTQRYKMCGNGLVAPVATWAGKRLEKVLG